MTFPITRINSPSTPSTFNGAILLAGELASRSQSAPGSQESQARISARFCAGALADGRGFAFRTWRGGRAAWPRRVRLAGSRRPRMPKPSVVITVARKPTAVAPAVAATVLEHGSGAVNIKADDGAPARYVAAMKKQNEPKPVPLTENWVLLPGARADKTSTVTVKPSDARGSAYHDIVVAQAGRELEHRGEVAVVVAATVKQEALSDAGLATAIETMFGWRPEYAKVTPRQIDNLAYVFEFVVELDPKPKAIHLDL